VVRYLFYTIGDLTYQSPLVFDIVFTHNGDEPVKDCHSTSGAATGFPQRLSQCRLQMVLGCRSSVQFENITTGFLLRL